MDDNDLITRADAAAAYGVSRQAIEAALARSTSPPAVIMTVAGKVQLYRRGDFHQWWTDRAASAWKETGRISKRGHGPRRQVNSRLTDEEFGQLKALLAPGQTVSALGAVLIREALAARQALP